MNEKQLSLLLTIHKAQIHNQEYKTSGVHGLKKRELFKLLCNVLR